MDKINGQKIREIFQQMFDANYYSGNPRVPPHTHNGIDNLQIASTGGSSIEVTDGTTTVDPVSIIEFPSGSVTDNGGGDVSIAISATPAGSNTQIQFNNAGAFGASSTLRYTRTLVGMVFFFHFFLGKIELVSDNGNGTVDRIVSAGGNGIQIESDDVIKIFPATNINLISDTGADGVGVVTLADAGTPPTTAPSGGVLYSSGGALHWLGSSGTDTVIAPA